MFDFERRDGQDFRHRPRARPGHLRGRASDDLAETVDYGALVDQVVAAVANDPVDLIETLAQRIADTCLRDDRVGDVEVTVHKPHAPIQATFHDVALTINRSR